MNLRYRIFFIFSIVLLFSFTCEAADTLKIHVIKKQLLDNTGHSSGFVTISQKIHTYGGILFRQINYDESTGQIAGYEFLFYRNGRLFTQEFYNRKDSLQYLLKHEYDPAGNEAILTKLVPGTNGLAPAWKMVKTYDSNRKLLQQKTFYGKQTGSIILYKYNKSGLLESERTTFKPVAKSVLKQETKSYSYSPENRISKVTVSGKDASGKPYGFTEEYRYNDKGLLSSIKKLNASNSISGEKVYKYLDSGTISQYEEHNAEGKLTLFFLYEYMKHYMESGTQVSYYENL